MIASPTADIEDTPGSNDPTCGGNVVEHRVWVWVQALIERREGASLVAGPYAYRRPPAVPSSQTCAHPSFSVRGTPRITLREYVLTVFMARVASELP